MSDNRGHKFEIQGKNMPESLRIDMTNFVNKLRGKK